MRRKNNGVKKCKKGVYALSRKGVRGTAQGVLFSSNESKASSFNSKESERKISALSASSKCAGNRKLPKRGRKSALSVQKLHELLNAYYSNYYTLRELAAMFNVSRSCVHRSLASVSREELMLAVPQLATVIL
ncbi:Uncharacterised protein [Candidatus Anstonella stagnisolia]|nr:Uncharacterised protein [Candidatus Anstonella stagnisolia]